MLAFKNGNGLQIDIQIFDALGFRRFTIDENIISAHKMQNNYGTAKYCDSNIGLFSIAPHKAIALNLLCFSFSTISLLHFLISYS